MAAMNQKRVLKRKLEDFLEELQHFGTVKGFRHFHCYVRSTEELIITVNNTLQGSSSGLRSAPQSRRTSLLLENSLPSSHLPHDKHSVRRADHTQTGQSDKEGGDLYLPPASPCEDKTPDADVTTFLIAGYLRYSNPYVWVRSNHSRFLQVSTSSDLARNSPLRLKSTTSWKDGDVQVTDIVAEVVQMCTYPAPWNPFEIDLQYFQSLPQPDQFLCSAAMMACLQNIVTYASDSEPYTVRVLDDLQAVAQFHFTCLRTMVAATDIPILQHNSPQHHPRHSQRQHREVQPHQQHPPGHSFQTRYPRITAAATTSLLQPPMTVTPSNTFSTSGVMYGKGFDGSFPGGFTRTPAPSLL